MSIWEWLLVILLNGSIVGYGLYLGRGGQSSSQWFLAGRTLPWWLMGLSMYATAIDAADLVADSGATYVMGFSFCVGNWIGGVCGWALGGFFIFVPMYRMGMYTNAEYLEARFGASARITSVFVQLQFRTLVMGMMSISIFRMLSVLFGWDWLAWAAVALVAALAAVYTAVGGMRSVVVTDTLQVVVMSAAALLIWLAIWGAVGGWEGMQERFQDAQPGLEKQMLHVGRDNIDREDARELSPKQIQGRVLTGGEFDPHTQAIVRRTPFWIFSLSMILLGLAYVVVNNTQAMRMLAARSLWDLRMSGVAAAAAMLGLSFFMLSIGVMGRALYPDQLLLPDQSQDSIYPLLISEFATGWLKPMAIAGLLAAAFSTYDSIGSTLSALLTRDVYARLLVRDAPDQHYRRVGQWLTPVVIGASFVYLPALLSGGMVVLYLEITSALVIPLFTLYIMGIFTRVHPRTGIIGLLVGSTYGAVRLLAPLIAESYHIQILPTFLLDKYGAYFYSLVLTSVTMLVASLVLGWVPSGQLIRGEQRGWLRTSQLKLKESRKGDRSRSAQILPVPLAIGLVATGVILSYVVFW